MISIFQTLLVFGLQFTSHTTVTDGTQPVQRDPEHRTDETSD